MDFRFTEEQQALRHEIRSLLSRVCPPEYVLECERAGRPPYEAFRALGEHGWLGISTPVQYGGAGLGPMEVCILLEEIGRAFEELALWVFRVLTYGVYAVLRDGTEEQKNALLPRVARGELSFCFGLTEPNAGSDAAAVSTRAVRVEDGWVITGEKVFTSGMLLSDYLLLVARTGQYPDKHKGITTFLVDTRTPGISATPIPTLGHRCIATTRVVLDNVHVPADAVLGRVDEGWDNVRSYLRYERLCLSAARLGAAEAAFTEALEYAKQRQQFGRPIGKFQAIQHKLADMKTLLEAGRWLVWHYAWLLQTGTDSVMDAAVVKLFIGEAYKRIADEALQIFGGYGYASESMVELHYRNARLATIGGGTSEIQRNIIARELGL